MQLFKGDEIELKYAATAEEILGVIADELDLFFADAYDNVPLGSIIYDAQRSPLANAIDRDIFIHSYKEIFDSFVVAGTFESYITVFTKIFGDDVDIQFDAANLTSGSALAPGKLNIDILAAGVELSPFVSRTIVDDEFVFDNMIHYPDATDDDTDYIVFQTIKGFKTQYELEQMLHEMVPGGIFTDIDLSLL
jgi:hypothetical protein